MSKELKQTMKSSPKKSQNISNSDPLEQSRVNFLFEEISGGIYIGGEKVTPQLFGILKDEARYIENSRFWEMFNATIANEAAEMALNKSQDWDHVLSAKQLYYWRKVFLTILKKLAQ